MENIFNWKRIKRRTTFLKILIYFISATTFLLAVSFVALYGLSAKTLLNEIGDHTESALVNGGKNTAQLMEWSINYAYSSSSDSQLESYALAEVNSTFETYTVWSRLMNVKNGNPSIDSVYLINDYTDSIIDSRLGLTDIDEFYDQEVLERLRTRKITDGAFLIPRTPHMPLNSSKYRRVITAIIPYETGKSISAFVLNVDADSIMTLLQANSFLETNLFVLNDKNEMIFSTDRLSQDQIQDFTAASSDKINGWKLYKPENEREQMLVYAQTSIKGIQNWRFYETIPKSVILSRIDFLRNITLLLFGGLLLVSLGVVALLSRKVYSPIQELVQNVMKQHQSEKQDGLLAANELDYLSQVFVFQSEKIHELTEVGRQHKFFARERFMRELLSGPAPSLEEIRQSIRRLEIELPEENLSVAIFRIDYFPSFVQNYSDKDQRLLRFAMTNIVGESLQPFFAARIQTVDMGADHIAVILPVDKRQPNAIADKLRESQRLVKQYLSISTTVASGKCMEGLAELHEGYMTVYEMTQERFRLGHGALVSEEQADSSPNELYHLPLELERQMVHAIQKADGDTLLPTMDAALSALRERPYFECKMSLITFFMHVRRSLQEAAPHFILSSSWGLTSVENQIMKLETLQAFGEWMEDLSSQTLAEIAAARNVSKKAGLVQEVDQLIAAHLTNPNLATKLLADELGLSINYLRNLYKLETTRSITETISERRLDIICEELLTSDKPIEPLSQKYGFTTLNTFYAAFKKRYGVTPAMYRKMNK
ncbi:hypothetical protein R50345_22595 [Paenibacillus sp. FSL R5-0345]|uniref:helix-turn-helix transcriptional regulator n=1 Tax=Paenibacillus sp. FSL R5-0345 TaxID=1536770 RepID=UPI0004F5EDFD|nr:helix-turn-helix domain-containing protein [Paenibacillus sp. FSL R5-0345]AIQ37182.1 hypothetical protein R50345_22595 [Paenibacillus sp. FSL R5-0345]